MQYILMICLLEPHLNHDTFDNDNLRIPGYELIRIDHLLNQKRGGIYLYISQRFSPSKSKQYQLFEGIFKFQSECIWETV